MSGQLLDIREMARQIEKGICGIGLRRQMLPHIVMRVCSTLRNEGVDSIDFLMRDVVGDAIRLASGRSSLGPAAFVAVSQAQAMSMVARREQRFKIAYEQDITGFVTSQKILVEHRDGLIQWIDTGVDPIDSADSQSDMTQIGQLIGSPTVRSGVASVFVAASQVLASGLQIFTNDQPIDQPINSNFQRVKDS